MDIPTINFEALCGAGAPAFVGYVELEDDLGNPITTVNYTISGKVALSPGATPAATFVISDAVVDGKTVLQYEILDTTTISPGIYQHQTLATNNSDSTVQVGCEGVMSFRSVL